MAAQPEPDLPTASPEWDEISQQLERVLTSRVFADSSRLQSFLRYVVEQTLDGNAERIKGFTIAQEVFERHDPEDAQASTIVRVEAGRLRRRLSEYYADEGGNNPLLISIPKGRYEQALEAVDANHKRGGPDRPNTQAYRTATLWMLGRKEEAREAMAIVNLQRALYDFPGWVKRVHRLQDDVEQVLGPLGEMGLQPGS